jgi:hypothetical protein
MGLKKSWMLLPLASIRLSLAVPFTLGGLSQQAIEWGELSLNRNPLNLLMPAADSILDKLHRLLKGIAGT